MSVITFHTVIGSLSGIAGSCIISKQFSFANSFDHRVYDTQEIAKLIQNESRIWFTLLLSSYYRFSMFVTSLYGWRPTDPNVCSISVRMRCFVLGNISLCISCPIWRNTVSGIEISVQVSFSKQAIFTVFINLFSLNGFRFNWKVTLKQTYSSQNIFTWGTQEHC